MRPGSLLSVALLLVLPLAATAAEKPPVDFERDVLPLLKDRCFACHDGRKHTSGLRLDVKARALKGGESGKPAVVPGDSAKSELIRRVTSTDDEVAMPYKSERLSAAEFRRCAAGSMPGRRGPTRWPAMTHRSITGPSGRRFAPRFPP